MFLNAVMLAGVAAAALPIVLQLLGRARVRHVPWGAMLFLDYATPGEAAWSRRRDWLLLIARMAATALLAIALARPFVGTPPSVAPPRGPAVMVLVIDATPSTGFVEPGGSRLELIRDAALHAVGRLARGDQVGLVLLGYDASEDMSPTADLQEVASRLAVLTAGLRSADLGEGQHRAAALAAAAGAASDATIACIADRQASTWNTLVASGGGDTPPPLIVTPIGSTASENVRIASVRLLAPPAVVGRPAEIEVRVRNDSPHATGETPLALRISDRSLDESAFELPAGGEARVVRSVTFRRAGSVVLTAALTPTGMPDDDTRSLAINVQPAGATTQPGVGYDLRNVPRGATIEHTFVTREKEASVFRPDERTDRAPVIPRGDGGVVVYGDTDLPGQYVLRVNDQLPVDVIVEDDNAESNLAPLDDAAIDSIASRADATRVAPSQIGPVRSAEPTGNGRELAIAGIAVVIVLLLLDALLTARLDRGAGVA